MFHRQRAFRLFVPLSEKWVNSFSELHLPYSSRPPRRWFSNRFKVDRGSNILANIVFADILFKMLLIVFYFSSAIFFSMRRCFTFSMRYLSRWHQAPRIDTKTSLCHSSNIVLRPRFRPYVLPRESGCYCQGSAVFRIGVGGWSEKCFLRCVKK